MTERTPWAAMLAVALRLGIAPAAFWRLSLKEWRALLAPQDAGLAREDFKTLMRRFPDRSHD